MYFYLRESWDFWESFFQDNILKFENKFVSLPPETKHVRIMTATILRKPSSASAMYMDMLEGASDEVKLEVATYLLASVTNKKHVVETPPPPPLSEEERKAGLMRMAGCWADDPEDAARMEAAVKECRENDVLREVNME